jgi:hypothetical protein
MHGVRAATVNSAAAKCSWSEIFRNASFYTWAAMLFTIGSIVVGARLARWVAPRAQCGYTLGAGVFAWHGML